MSSTDPSPTRIVRVHPSWRTALAAELDAPYMRDLGSFLRAERAAGVEVYPPGSSMFAALDRTPLPNVRVVIVGQDPYHGAGQAMGLAFSVPRGVPVPPSLRNIVAEVERDVGAHQPSHGDLSAWADQGVLLLNTVLSVRAHAAGSHAGRGWERFTDAVIDVVAARREAVVFLLWGRHAQAKAARVDRARHLVLEAAHPSPLSAAKGFNGCGHFSRANAWLQERHGVEIDWSRPD